eukprot:COSAG05_NODE_20584_length_278_cov_0.804469_1_plen_34_part_10
MCSCSACKLYPNILSFVTFRVHVWLSDQSIQADL